MTVHIAPSAAVCVQAQLNGAVTVGAQSAVHPGATVCAADGAAIVLGDRCFVEDGAALVTDAPGEMLIGSGNVFESGCVVRSRRVGHNNWFEPKAECRADSVIGDNCLIGSGVVVAQGECVPDNTVLVVVQTPLGDLRRVTRTQRTYLREMHAALVQKYAAVFARGSKSVYALEKHHELRT
ncbi:unnamed protein product [Hyaloperonospora brassicae]|uniref:Dynactin subunit 6 n=1 Tax=Hyaloperonospora brassicae TaxID=162125 RepID=A0AAV0UZ72_HYABA|nr:unnamed protein product [Hyaloperonospora brassicae]